MSGAVCNTVTLIMLVVGPIAGMLIGWLLHSLCNGRPVDVIYRLDDTSHFHITAPNVSGAIKLIGTLSERP